MATVTIYVSQAAKRALKNSRDHYKFSWVKRGGGGGGGGRGGEGGGEKREGKRIRKDPSFVLLTVFSSSCPVLLERE